ncbi:PREDICTED: coiled-coil domain-containing protein 96-like isoform X2 [Amphimedon queenslandica]|uniref:CCDC113/CCDC96 coiled-coil domain-containing protein n=1 Tax=Amphimedon queenslandica TaxID=400682 RepID=A0AAN0J621_AMPQE|nr:PREDICTED: coiled-coil domain-containing protein 96-like isoform X2 [Amphimedon queenslandica]|eukprot:XP_019852197.1 PREDICTED: coiled-coil domain-containing protein 96-like isoform X2 [Amphimedon queenslandica]
MSEVKLDNGQEEGKEAMENENAGTGAVTDEDTKTVAEATEDKQIDEAKPAEQTDQPTPLDGEEGGIERQTVDLSDKMQGEGKDESDAAKTEDESSKETETKENKEGEKEQLDGASEETDRKEEEEITNKPEEEVEATGDTINKTEEVEGETVKSSEEMQEETPRVPSIIVMNEEGQEMEEEQEKLDEIDEEEDDEEEEEEEEEEFDLNEAIETYKKLLGSIEKLQQTHHQLQHKIAEYLARKQLESKHDSERDSSDQEQRYQKCLEGLDEIQHELSEKQKEFEMEDAELMDACEIKKGQVSQARNEFVELVKGHASTCIRGKKLSIISDYLNTLEKKDGEVTQVRLENITLQSRIQKIDSLIKQKEQLAEGLHMIDFEQLRINNADLNDKIEERNEEIMKLKKKITSTIQVLAHLKEKLQFLQAENAVKKSLLKDVDKQVAKKRDFLTRLKQAKDSVRAENNSLKQQGGLVGYHTLLRDFENKQDQSEKMKSDLERLQQRHSNLILQCNTLRQRIDQTKLLQTQ